jgi:hypothetical protein
VSLAGFKASNHPQQTGKRGAVDARSRASASTARHKGWGTRTPALPALDGGPAALAHLRPSAR